MSATTSRRRTRREQIRIPTSTLLFVLFAMVVGIGGSYVVLPPAASLDARMCRKDLVGMTQVFVDTTDPLSPRQATATDKIVKDAFRELMPGALLEVGTLGATWDGLWTPSLTLCRTAIVSQESDSGATTRHLERVYEEAVAPKLNLISSDLRSAHEAQSSPIYEAIAAAAASGAEQHSQGVRRLILISDFLEATRDFSEPQNRSLTARAVTLPVFSAIKADLTGVRVQLYVLERTRAPGLQTPGHRAFIKAWFAQRGAVVDDPVLLNY